MSNRSSPITLTGLAWANVVLHLAGLAMALVAMRPGSPAFDLETRRAFLTDHPMLWSLGWGTWMVCALMQVAFYAVLASNLPAHPHASRFAVTIASAGAAVDILCDSIFITVLPRVAAEGVESQSVFLALERLAAAGGLIVANGFYVLAVLILTLCLPRREMASIAAGYATFGFGLLLTAAGFTGVTWHAEAMTGPTIAFYCLWTILVARSFRSSGNDTGIHPSWT
jgi:hypothetical protein